MELSKAQVEWLKKDLKSEVKSYAISFSFVFASVFVLLYDREYKELAIGLFVFGIARIFYK